MAAVRALRGPGHTVLELAAAPQAGRTRLFADPAGIDVVLVLDTSYSMQDQANSRAEGVAKLFSRLDVARHAARTVLASLSAQDRAALVTFDTEAVLRSALTADVAAVDEAVQNTNVNGCTNLWGGLELGLRAAAAARTPSRRQLVLLLTDGLPQYNNYGTPPDEKANLKAMLAELENNDIEVHCFGFGYSLNTELLDSLAEIGHGTYNFIPDGSMVGTVLINALANAAAAALSGVRVRLPGVESPSAVCGGLPVEGMGHGVVVHLGDIRGGELRHVVVTGDVSAARIILADGTEVEVDFSTVEDDDAEVAKQLARCAFVKVMPLALRAAKISLETGRTKLEPVLSEADAARHPLADDLTGQVAEAFATMEALDRWGAHYLPSLMGAHRDERCNNFKDLGVQSYAGDVFHQCRERLDAIFSELPPPVPSLSDGSDTYVVGVPAITFAQAFNDMSNGCFAPDTLVQLDGDTAKRIDRLQKGDVVRTPQGAAEVVCVTRHVNADGQPLVTIPGSGLRVTPWHPVRLAGQTSWSFPAWLAPAVDTGVTAVWNVILERGHTAVYADGVEACTLGHGLVDDVVRHPYFGTQAVVDDIRAADPAGFAEGIVTVAPSTVRRDATTRRVTSVAVATA